MLLFVTKYAIIILISPQWRESMDFKQLLELLNENQEAQNFIKGIQETQETNVLTINKNETLINNLKGDLDKFKQGNNLVKSTLGLEQLNEESLSQALNSLKKGDLDEKSRLEIENLKSELSNSTSLLTEKENAFNTQIRELKLGTQLSDLLVKNGVLPNAVKSASREVSQMIKYDDNNNPIFLNEDGSTKYLNGKPMGLEDAVTDIKTTHDYMFVRDTKSGGGSQGNEGKSQPPVNQGAVDAKSKGDLNAFLSASLNNNKE